MPWKTKLKHITFHEGMARTTLSISTLNSVHIRH